MNFFLLPCVFPEHQWRLESHRSPEAPPGEIWLAWLQSVGWWWRCDFRVKRNQSLGFPHREKWYPSCRTWFVSWKTPRCLTPFRRVWDLTKWHSEHWEDFTWCQSIMSGMDGDISMNTIAFPCTLNLDSEKRQKNPRLRSGSAEEALPRKKKWKGGKNGKRADGDTIWFPECPWCPQLTPPKNNYKTHFCVDETETFTENKCVLHLRTETTSNKCVP